MPNVFNEVTPQDAYIVIDNNSSGLFYMQYLIELYQPIIGVEATNLYITLHNKIFDSEEGHPDLYLHRQLIVKMNLSFSLLMKARRTLEAVGLIKSKKYKHYESDKYLYEYTLLCPLVPKYFFQSDVLSMILLNRIGKNNYLHLKKRLLDKTDWNKGKYILEEEITKSFDEVFDFVLTSEFKKTTVNEIDEMFYPCNERCENENNIKIKNNHLDLAFIKGMVSNLHQLDKTLDDNMISILQELAFLYKFSDMEMVNLLNDHFIYSDKGRIDEKLLRERALEKFQYRGKEIKVIRSDEKKINVVIEESTILNKAEKHKLVLENYSPLELIQQYQGKGKIPDADVKIVDSLLYEYKLPAEVVNVLVEYVMLSNEYKLPKKLIEKIAGHWKRLKINTVSEALEVAKKEHQLYKDWTSSSNTKVTSDKTRGKTYNKDKKENVPDYILNQDEKYNKDSNNSDNELNVEELEEINRLIKKLDN